MGSSGVKSKASLVSLKMEQEESKRLDWLKWLIVLVLFFAWLIGSYYYRDVSLAWRILGWLGIATAISCIAFSTQQGKWAIDFIRDSRMELRKVVWLTRQEVMQITLVVTSVVIVLALVLWGMDGILVWLVGWLTGQRS